MPPSEAPSAAPLLLPSPSRDSFHEQKENMQKGTPEYLEEYLGKLSPRDRELIAAARANGITIECYARIGSKSPWEIFVTSPGSAQRESRIHVGYFESNLTQSPWQGELIHILQCVLYDCDKQEIALSREEIEKLQNLFRTFSVTNESKATMRILGAFDGPFQRWSPDDEAGSLNIHSLKNEIIRSLNLGSSYVRGFHASDITISCSNPKALPAQIMVIDNRSNKILVVFDLVKDKEGRIGLPYAVFSPTQDKLPLSAWKRYAFYCAQQEMNDLGKEGIKGARYYLDQSANTLEMEITYKDDSCSEITVNNEGLISRKK
jgi:hypothetical protein